MAVVVEVTITSGHLLKGSTSSLAPRSDEYSIYHSQHVLFSRGHLEVAMDAVLLDLGIAVVVLQGSQCAAVSLIALSKPGNQIKLLARPFMLCTQHETHPTVWIATFEE